MTYIDALEADRRAKLNKVAELGANPYGAATGDSWCGVRTAKARFAAFEHTSPNVRTEQPHARLKGRVVSKNNRGKLKFFFLQDREDDIQLMFSRSDFNDRDWELASQIDVFDHVYADGRLGRTKTGEITLSVQTFGFLGKSIAPPPEKFRGVTDQETLVRQRYLALIQDPKLRRNLVSRSKTLKALRDGLDAQDYVEVETPVLGQHASGAAARPFKTRYNALDQEFYLRVAPELDLKRLIVGGMERVFEIGKVFRNEGVDATHNPEFTILECYEAYADFRRMMRLCQDLVGRCLRGQQTFMVSSYCDLMEGYAKIPDPWDEGDVLTKTKDLPEGTPHWNRVESLFDALVAPKLQRPSFVTHYPSALCPLARRCDDDPKVADRFELFAAGMEVANGYSELNDPDEQLRNFVTQTTAEARDDYGDGKNGRGDPEFEKCRDDFVKERIADRVDTDYVRALKVGLPMAGGLGIGVDRLVMLSTDSASIREVLAFPLTKRKKI